MSEKKEFREKMRIKEKINNMKHHGASKINERLASCLADGVFMSPTW